jgi:response regulator NasT
MSAPPVKELTVMLVDNEPARAAIVEQAMMDSGYRVIRRLDNAKNLTEAVTKFQPDMVIIDIESPDRDVLFAEEDDSHHVEAAIRAGVSAYVVDGVKRGSVKAILQVAIARFREFHALRSELETVKSQLEDRKLIDKAKGLIMKHQKCDEPAAYQALRKLAMDRSQRMTDVARNIISVMELMGGSK